MRLPPAHRTSTSPVEADRGLTLGIEQEYDLFAGTRRLDFRAHFREATRRSRPIPFRNCDSAAALDAGYVLACDEQEAEFATVPVSHLEDGCLNLAREVMRCRRHMLRLLGGIGARDVRGYSTHLNVRVPAGREWELAWSLAAIFGPALVLLTEARPSPGLLIRPRRGRLEIGSEYIDHEDQLAAACVFLAGAVQICLHYPEIPAELPRLEVGRWEEANIRPGIYLPHDAYGDSIYAHGRQATLKLESGELITAGAHLDRCVSLVLDELGAQVSARARNTLLHFVEEAGSLQIETQADPGRIAHPVADYSPAPEARALQALTSLRGRREIAARFLDWEGAAFSLGGTRAPLVVGVPWRQLPDFIQMAAQRDLARFALELGSAAPTLNSLEQLQSAGVYQAVDPVALGHQALGGKSGGKPGSPSGKPSTKNTPTYVAPPLKRKWIGWLIGAIVTSIVAILVYSSVNATHGGGSSRLTVTPTAAATRTAALAVTPSPRNTSTLTPTFTLTPSASPLPTRARPTSPPPQDTPEPQPPPPTQCDPATGNCGQQPPPPTQCDPATGNCGQQPPPPTQCDPATGSCN